MKNIAFIRNPIYHIGGLLPIKELNSCRVITHSIGMDKNAWGVRRLSNNEVYDCLDISKELIPTDFNFKSWINEQPIPAQSWIVMGSLVCGIDSDYRFDKTHLPAPKRLALSAADPPALGINQTDIFLLYGL